MLLRMCITGTLKVYSWTCVLVNLQFKTIRLIHLSVCSFLECGSDVITTATYQASIEGFIKHLGFKPEEAEDLIMSGVQLARESTADFMASSLTAGVSTHNFYKLSVHAV